MAILGAILGDIAGSQYEYDRPENLDRENCDIFSDDCEFTDDTVMSLVIKYAIDNKIDYETAMRKVGQHYPICGYGDIFFNWMFYINPKPYIRCFYENDSYISFIRNVFSLDCDCDTICAIGGGIAEEYYKKTGIKNSSVLQNFLDRRLYNIWKKDIN